MNNPALANELNLLLATETRSLFRHLDEAKPYLTAKTYRAWQELTAMSHASREHGDRIAAILNRLELPQRPVSFSVEVANYHFLSLGSLLPLLAAEKRQQIASYQRVLQHRTGSVAIDDELIDLLVHNQAQLDTLESFHALVAGANATAGAKG